MFFLFDVIMWEQVELLSWFSQLLNAYLLLSFCIYDEQTWFCHVYWLIGFHWLTDQLSVLWWAWLIKAWQPQQSSLVCRWYGVLLSHALFIFFLVLWFWNLLFWLQLARVWSSTAPAPMTHLPLVHLIALSSSTPVLKPCLLTELLPITQLLPLHCRHRHLLFSQPCIFGMNS